MGLAGRWAPTPPIVTDSQGRFEALVPYGEIGYQVVAGQWGIYHRSSVAGPTFPGREPVELLLDPPGSPLPIRGTVTAPAGQAVSGLTVTIVGEYGDRWQSLTDPYGRFQIAGFGELRQSVAVVRSGGLAAPLRLIDRRGPVTNLALALAPAATLAGTVRDTQDNTPIPGATVTILPPYANDFRMQATTGRDGRYLIEGIPPGPYHVTAIAPGRFYPLPRGMVSELPETALPAGATVTADLAMQRSVLLRGRVVDVSGRPVPGAMVCAQGQNMGDYPDPHVGTRTGGDGQFLLDGGQAYQLITLAAFDPRAGQSQMEVCPPAPGRIVDGLVLKTHGSMRVRGIVTDAGGRGIPGVTCLAYHASETAATTGPDGRFDLGRIPLPSGGKPLLSLRAPRPGHTGAGTPPEAPWFFHRRVTLDPVADDDAQLKLSLEPTVLLRFAGRVTDARGAPVANARVWVFTGEADEETWQETIHPQTMMGRDWKVPRPGYNMGAVQTGPDGRWALTAVRERGTRPFEQGGAPWSRFCVGVVTSSGDKNVFVRDIAGPPGGKPIDVPINLDAPPATRPATRPGA
ncbi:MAG: carboxypeptidase regulatory-like domain-containing protein [Planctomycetota bacterium]|nr:carboxypeptidase regulatory-like domain-containing protein [Planctomycetota bacterium]